MKEWSKFELEIEKTNQFYLRKKLGVVEKIPNGNKTIRINGMAQIVRDKRTGCDFIGHLKGLPIAFDCKSTKNKTSFPLGSKSVVMFKPHQLEFLADYDATGGFSFLLLKLRNPADVFLLPISDFLSLRERLAAEGRKSIPMQQLIKYRVPMRGIYIDYAQNIPYRKEDFCG